MALILTDCSQALSLARTAQERHRLQNVELMAKNELISLAKAIDTAANKGELHIYFKLSPTISRLNIEDQQIAQEIIEQDIKDAGYAAKRIKDNNDMTIGYELNWDDEASNEEEA